MLMTNAYLDVLVRAELLKPGPDVYVPEPWPNQPTLDEVLTRKAHWLAEKDAGRIDWLAWQDVDAPLVVEASRLNRERNKWLREHPAPTAQPNDELLARWDAAVKADDVPELQAVLKAVFPEGVLVLYGSGWSEDRIVPVRYYEPENPSD